ncbi:MAG: recombinase family protein [Actinomycetota bacterium]|nr:recombinase family protein [Actinomycetota bacterium]
MAAKGKLALVVRVSDVKGRDKKGDRFISPELQIAGGSGYARGRGFTEFEVFEDLNVSHTTPLDSRAGMSAALAKIEAGKLAGLVVSSQDRLGPVALTHELKARLLAAGAILLVPDNPAAEVLDAKGFAALPADLVAQIHTAQREEIGLRWHKARRSAVEYGIHPSTLVPVGYRRNDVEPQVSGKAERAELAPEQRWADPVKRQLVPSEYAPVILALFKLRAAKGSWSECCKLLEDAGVPNAKAQPEWIHSSTQAIIRNPVYMGWANLLSKGKQDGDIINETAHQPIVDPLLWKAAQPKEGKPRRTSDGSLLSGVLRCACCGRKLTPSTSTRKGKVYAYYRCRPKMVTGPECDAPASVPAAEVEALVTRSFFDWMAYRPVAPVPPDLAPLEQAVAMAKADEAKWKEAAVAGTVAPEVVGPAYDAAKARREEAEKRLFEARQTAGLDDERLTLAERWGTMTIPERRRALQAFEVVAYIERGRQLVDERVTIELRGSPVSDGWEPDVDYTLPSDQELAERITAEFAAAGIVITNMAERIAAWNAKYADTKVVIRPIKLSEEDKATADAIFGVSA